MALRFSLIALAIIQVTAAYHIQGRGNSHRNSFYGRGSTPNHPPYPFGGEPCCNDDTLLIRLPKGANFEIVEDTENDCGIEDDYETEDNDVSQYYGYQTNNLQTNFDRPYYGDHYSSHNNYRNTHQSSNQRQAQYQSYNQNPYQKNKPNPYQSHQTSAFYDRQRPHYERYEHSPNSNSYPATNFPVGPYGNNQPGHSSQVSQITSYDQGPDQQGFSRSQEQYGQYQSSQNAEHAQVSVNDNNNYYYSDNNIPAGAYGNNQPGHKSPVSKITNQGLYQQGFSQSQEQYGQYQSSQNVEQSQTSVNDNNNYYYSDNNIQQGNGYHQSNFPHQPHQGYSEFPQEDSQFSQQQLIQNFNYDNNQENDFSAAQVTYYDDVEQQHGYQPQSFPTEPSQNLEPAEEEPVVPSEPELQVNENDHEEILSFIKQETAELETHHQIKKREIESIEAAIVKQNRDARSKTSRLNLADQGIVYTDHMEEIWDIRDAQVDSGVRSLLRFFKPPQSKFLGPAVRTVGSAFRRPFDILSVPQVKEDIVKQNATVNSGDSSSARNPLYSISGKVRGYFDNVKEKVLDRRNTPSAPSDETEINKNFTEEPFPSQIDQVGNETNVNRASASETQENGKNVEFLHQKDIYNDSVPENNLRSETPALSLSENLIINSTSKETGLLSNEQAGSIQAESDGLPDFLTSEPLENSEDLKYLPMEFNTENEEGHIGNSLEHLNFNEEILGQPDADVEYNLRSDSGEKRVSNVDNELTMLPIIELPEHYVAPEATADHEKGPMYEQYSSNGELNKELMTDTSSEVPAEFSIGESKKLDLVTHRSEETSEDETLLSSASQAADKIENSQSLIKEEPLILVHETGKQNNETDKTAIEKTTISDVSLSYNNEHAYEKSPNHDNFDTAYMAAPDYTTEIIGGQDKFQVYNEDYSNGKTNIENTSGEEPLSLPHRNIGGAQELEMHLSEEVTNSHEWISENENVTGTEIASKPPNEIENSQSSKIESQEIEEHDEKMDKAAMENTNSTTILSGIGLLYNEQTYEKLIETGNDAKSPDYDNFDTAYMAAPDYTTEIGGQDNFLVYDEFNSNGKAYIEVTNTSGEEPLNLPHRNFGESQELEMHPSKEVINSHEWISENENLIDTEIASKLPNEIENTETGDFDVSDHPTKNSSMVVRNPIGKTDEGTTLADETFFIPAETREFLANTVESIREFNDQRGETNIQSPLGIIAKGPDAWNTEDANESNFSAENEYFANVPFEHNTIEDSFFKDIIETTNGSKIETNEGETQFPYRDNESVETMVDSLLNKPTNTENEAMENDSSSEYIEDWSDIIPVPAEDFSKSSHDLSIKSVDDSQQHQFDDCLGRVHKNSTDQAEENKLLSDKCIEEARKIGLSGVQEAKRNMDKAYETAMEQKETDVELLWSCARSQWRKCYEERTELKNNIEVGKLAISNEAEAAHAAKLEQSDAMASCWKESEELSKQLRKNTEVALAMCKVELNTVA